jgi:hypothetical protein
MNSNSSALSESLRELLDEAENLLRNASVSELIQIGAGTRSLAVFPEAMRVFSDCYFSLDCKDRALEEYWGQFGVRESVSLVLCDELCELDGDELAEFADSPRAEEKADKIRQRALAELPRQVRAAYEESLDVLDNEIERRAAQQY